MGSDRARNSYDARQQYRSVVTQQGRVTLEADQNEAWKIATEEQREQVLDIVGPRGTPDDGYEVSLEGLPPDARPRDFRVGPGTMYVGGLRVTLPEPGTTYEGQRETEWVDGPEAPSPTTRRELIYLHLREQEVSAVEDEALREVALGGPDTSQRTRLRQRLMRIGVSDNTLDCESALADARTLWRSRGLELEPETMRLVPTARLQVDYEPPAEEGDPECDPAAQAGYLGAENQLIRVQISSSGTLLWAYDNASHLYRVEVLEDGTVVRLRSSPVDAFHHPRTGQVVEVLRPAVRLANGQYVAAPTGLTRALSDPAPYDPDTRRLTLGTSLPAEYREPERNPLLFARIWEQELALTADTPLTLGHTGVRVRLTGGPFVPGDHWMFAVRPSTPQRLYPQRYLESPQPPEGARQWVCPLALLVWSENDTGRVIADCRLPFENLVELTGRGRGGGCCRVMVSPEEVSQRSLQAIIDEHARARSRDEHLTVCFAPGTYRLEEPLRLRHSRLTLEGCQGAVLVVPSEADRFRDGIIVLEQVEDITLRGLEIPIPRVPSAAVGPPGGMPEELFRRMALAEFFANSSMGMGIRLVRSSRVSIQGCRFDYSGYGEEPVSRLPFLAAGIFANDACTGLEVRNNEFLFRTSLYGSEPEESEWRHMAFGYLHTPSLVFQPSPTLSWGVTLPVLDEALFEENRFSGLTAAVLVHAMLGSVRLERNQVRHSRAGFWLMSLGAALFAGPTTVPDIPEPRSAKDLFWVWLRLARDPLVLVASTLAQGYPLPSDVKLPLRTVRGDEVPNEEAFITTSTQFMMLMVRRAADWFTGSLNLPSDIPDWYEQTGSLFDQLYRGFASVRLMAYRELPSPRERAPSALHITGNDIETGHDDSAHSTALTVWDAEADATCALVLGSNRLSSRDPHIPTVRIITPERSTVTGNMAANRFPSERVGPWSFLLIPSEQPGQSPPPIAITGNVLLPGWAVLPRRIYSDVAWADLNAVGR